MNRRYPTSQETAYQRWDLRMRRLRLMTDVMEDYQDNVRRMIRLMGCELGISNHVYNTANRANMNAEEWMSRVSQVTADMYSAESPSTERRRNNQQEPRSSPIYEPEHVPYSFNEMPPPTQSGFIYTQFSDVAMNSGITSEQINAATELVQYDGSMNESRCPISWDSFTVGQNVLKIRACGHIFCENALRRWFTNHNVCPVCRTVVGGETLSDRFANPITTDSSGNTSIINQILTGIVNSLNSASNNNNQIYESEIEFNVTDLLDAYTRLNPRR